jgi:RNA polymerase sigma-70 factor (ECF subfamily)
MDDLKIVQLCWDRDEQAIPATADKYGSYCTAIAKNILGNNEDAEECVNDTYLNAWNSMPPHRPSVLSTFLGKITRNLSFNRHKHNTADKRGGGELLAVLDELADCVSGKEDMEQEFNR